MNIDDFPVWHYGEDEETANSTLEQILGGSRRMISSIYDPNYGDDAYPKAGDVNVITDWAGTPKCVIRTTDVKIMDYGDVPFEIARLEQGDETLEDWQIHQGEVFQAEAMGMDGYTKLFLEIFEVVELL